MQCLGLTSMKYSIILVQPSRAGNVGAVCRLVQNFGNPRLIIVDNQADLDDNADFRRPARHAKDLLSNIIHVKTLEEALKMNISYAVATTARQAVISTSRICFTPSEIPWQDLGKHPAIVFGSESYGLDNNDIAKCDYIVTIPTSSEYSSINLSHAVAIMCHYFYTYYLGETQAITYEPASYELKQQLEKSFSQYADRFLRKERRHVSKEIFHNLIGAFKQWEFHIKKLENKM